MSIKDDFKKAGKGSLQLSGAIGCAALAYGAAVLGYAGMYMAIYPLPNEPSWDSAIYTGLLGGVAVSSTAASAILAWKGIKNTYNSITGICKSAPEIIQTIGSLDREDLSDLVQTVKDDVSRVIKKIPHAAYDAAERVIKKIPHAAYDAAEYLFMMPSHFVKKKDFYAKLADSNKLSSFLLAGVSMSCPVLNSMHLIVDSILIHNEGIIDNPYVTLHLTLNTLSATKEIGKSVYQKFKTNNL